MQCVSTIACHLERCRGWGIVKGEGSDFVIQASSPLTIKFIIMSHSCEPAKQNSSPLVFLLGKRTKIETLYFAIEILLVFVNFKISFTRKNWLLKFGFAYSLAQILEPKLLVYEILKFT